MNSVAAWRSLGLCVSLLWGGGALRSSQAQPPWPTSEDNPPSTAEEVSRLIGGPTLITLQHKDSLPQAIFEDASKQAGLELLPYLNLWERAGMKTPLPMNIHRQPFWLAMRALTSQANVYLYYYADKPGLTIIPGSDPKMRGVATMSGPFLVIANSLQRTLSLPDVLVPSAAPPANPVTAKTTRPTPGPAPGTVAPAPKPAVPTTPRPTAALTPSEVSAAQSEFRVTLSAFVDPKLRVIPTLSRFKVEEAVDEHGNSLVRADAEESAVTTVTPLSLQTVAALSRPPLMSRHLVRLRGSFRIFAVTKRDVMVVPNIMTAKDVTKTMPLTDNKTVPLAEGNRRFTVMDVKKVGEQYEVQLSITRQSLIAPESVSAQERQVNSYLNMETIRAARLLDDKGRRLTYQTYRSSGTANSYIIVFSKGSASAADRPGEPTKLVWDIPVETKQIVVPFEFTNLPLP